MEQHPVRLVLADDLRRSRLTVFFRLLLSLPHVIWFLLWALLVPFAAVPNWLFMLVAGRPAKPLHRFLAAYVRYSTHLASYLLLAGNLFPGFTGKPGYPVDVTLEPPLRQGRWRTLLRGLLALPALMLSLSLAALGAFGLFTGLWLIVGSLAVTCGFLAWFAALALGRIPRGLRDLIAYGIGYSGQTYAYLFLLTDRYPNADPERLGAAWELPDHPVRLELVDDGRRSRLTVFFRLLVALPHIVWATLWGVLALLAALVNGLVTLIRGRSAISLHRFLTAYVRYSAHLTAFVCLVANPFPGFTGARGYPVDVSIGASERQSRWITLFRVFLALPALFVASAFGGALFLVALLGWFAALVMGRMPLGLRNLGALAIRYLAQVNAYWLVVTDHYPYAGPALRPPAPRDEDATLAPPAHPPDAEAAAA